MKSGGVVSVYRLDPSAVTNTDARRGIEEDELKLGVRDQNGNIVSAASIQDSTLIYYNGQYRRWSEIRDQLIQQGRQATQNQSLASAANLSPQQVAEMAKNDAKQQAIDVFNIVRALESAQSQNQNQVRVGTQTYQVSELTQWKEALARLINNIRAANQQLGIANRNDGVDSQWERAAGVSSLPGSNGDAGTGSFSSSSRGMSLPGQTGQTGQPGPAGVQGQNGSRGIGFPGGAGVGTGDPLFDGFTPPTSAAYGAALYMDGQISDGLGQLGQSRREGQKLMMLFFYFARMAESGDPFAMYNFIKFITYIISKDKARQNIHIGSKLIQLQDLSRKASDLVTQSNTTDPNKVNDFMKTLHEAKSQEAMISTAQKLLADMLQEYAGVTEGLINSTRGLQDFWKRAVSTSTRP